MNVFDYFHDPFLRSLNAEEKNAVNERLQQWGLYTQSFAERLDNWFCNFDESDHKRLALRVFHALKYYTPDDFARRLKQLYRIVERHLADTGNDPSDIILVTPDGAADSADRHAYDVVKQWKLLRDQVYTVSELSERTFQDPVFVLFNDTHGTGNQFLMEIWPTLQQYGEHKIYVLAVAISPDALRRFRMEMPRVHVIPHIPVESAWSIFTGEECACLREIGDRVYSKHPMGYGDTALMTAYYFQCPNNTLPLIWADGENNNIDGHRYSWSPLFPYIPKSEPAEGSRVPIRSPRVETREAQECHSRPEASQIEARPSPVLTYRYRVGLLDLDLGLTNLLQVASELNKCQRFFHFTAPHRPDLTSADAAVITIDRQRNLSVYQIAEAFFSQFDELTVDVVGCFTRYPLAFVNRLEGSARFNYFSGPSNVDSRFMFISASQLRDFAKAAGCSFEEGLTYILVSQLVVYFTDTVGYHDETLECPMDFCEIRAHMTAGGLAPKSETTSLDSKSIERRMSDEFVSTEIHARVQVVGSGTAGTGRLGSRGQPGL